MSVKIQKQSQWFATFTKNREMKYLLLFVFVPLATFSQSKPVVEIQYLRKSNGNWVEAQDTIVVTTDVNQTLVSSKNQYRQGRISVRADFNRKEYRRAENHPKAHSL
jgi:hypothetical protein